MKDDNDDGDLHVAFTSLIVSDAKQYLRIYSGENCSYGSTFQMIKNAHTDLKIKAYVEITASGMQTTVRTYEMVPGQAKNMGCGKATSSQPKKFKILFAEYT